MIVHERRQFVVRRIRNHVVRLRKFMETVLRAPPGLCRRNDLPRDRRGPYLIISASGAAVLSEPQSRALAYGKFVFPQLPSSGKEVFKETPIFLLIGRFDLIAVGPQLIGARYIALVLGVGKHQHRGDPLKGLP